jgi:hypothetical protein
MPPRLDTLPENGTPVAAVSAVDAARQALLEDRQRREQECSRRLDALCQELNCRIAFVQQVVNGVPEPGRLVVIAN